MTVSSPFRLSDRTRRQAWKAFRQQLPVYSPISLRSVLESASAVLSPHKDVLGAVENRLRELYSADGVWLYGSGTEALQVALHLAWDRARESRFVAVPAFGCFDIAAAAVAFGRPIALYDLDPETLNPDLDSLEQVLRRGAQVVVVAPLYGIPVDWEEIATCLASYGAIGVEDAAQGHGARWDGQRIGSLGSVSVLSFGRGKGWTGIAGGALLARAKVSSRDVSAPAQDGRRILAEVALLVKAATVWAVARPSLYRLPASVPWLGLGETRYRDAASPAPIVRAAAALMWSNERRSAKEAKQRRSNARMILERLPESRAIRPIRIQPRSEPGFLRLPVLLSGGLSGFSRPEDPVRMGIAASYPTPLSDLKAVRACLRQPVERCPGAEELSRRLVTIPTHSRLTRADMEQVLQLLHSYGS